MFRYSFCRRLATFPLIFLIQALVLIALPVVVLRFSGLKGRLPLVVVQILVGIALAIRN